MENDLLEMENLSLFDDSDNRSSSIIKSSASLDVVKLSFSGVSSCSWKELFQGYDNLYAITYSSGIGFVYQLLSLFDKAEIIFGCDEVMSYSLQEIMAYQYKMIERISSTAGRMKMNLIERINNDSLHLYVARKVLSHEKIYLLSAADGRKRVIMGSANMSFSAFGGGQRENICYIDGDEAYDWYWGCYCDLKESSTDNISQKVLCSSDLSEELDELPISQTVQVKKMLVVEPITEAREEVRFVLDTKNLAEKYASSVPKPDKNGKIILTPEKIKTIRRHIVSGQEQEREMQSEYPRLQLILDEGAARLNDIPLDLNPSFQEVQNDVRLFFKYMNGYEKFHGDIADMQRRYYEFANWFFCSPFMAGMRDLAARYNQNRLPYPIFGLIYGQSKAGKTSFLETLLKMMIGQKTKISAPEFTRSSIEALKRTVQGAPIIVDDLTSIRFNQHAVETIKNDDFGVLDHLLYYPAVVISANEDVKAVSQEIIRRTVICRVQAGLTNTEVMRSNVVRTVQREIGTAFYREYLRRMLEVCSDLQEMMKDDESENAPDILAASSRILIDIFKEYSDEPIPVFVRELTLEDYFSEKVTGSQAIKTISDAWQTSRKSFVISEQVHELRYNAGQTWEAERILKELPETLEAHKSREWVIMNLDEARKFFDIPFQQTWFERFRK